MWKRLRERNEWKFFAVLPQADGRLAFVWWLVLLLRGVLPAVFAIAMGALVAAVQRGDSLIGPLALTGIVFVLLQVLAPIQTAVSHNLGDRTAAWLYDRLTRACVRPPGMGHLEDPRLTADLTVARDFDLGMTGPPLSYGLDFIAGGLVEMIGGLSAAAVLFGYAWWAPMVLAGAWLATHWLLRESAVWHDRNTDEVRSAQRDADYAYRLAVDPPGSKELRLFGLVGWTIDRFIARRTKLHQLQYHATRLRERPLLWSLLLVTGANVIVFWSLASAVAARQPRSRRARRLRAVRGRHLAHRVRRTELGDGRRGGAGRRGAAPRAGDGARRRVVVRPSSRGRPSRARDSFPRRDLCVPRRCARPRRLRPHHPRRLVARHRRTERRRKDDARQAPVPAVRPAGRRDRDRRRGRARARPAVVALAPDGGVSGFHPLRAAAARQRRARRAPRITSCSRRSRRPAPRSSRGSTRSSRAATTTARICRAGNGSAWRWRARSAP